MARVLIAIVLVVAGCGGGGGGKPSDARADRGKDAAPDAPGAELVGEAGEDVVSDSSSDSSEDAGTDEGAPPSDATDATGSDAGDRDTASADGVEAGDLVSGGDATDVPPPRMLTVAFTGKVVTVAMAPFGFDGTARLEPVSGSFSYDPGLPDELPSDPLRGRYDRGRTAFTFAVKNRTVTGSGLAILHAENMSSDTFRFIDGTQIDNKPRIMKLDGADAPAVKLFIAITDGTGAMLKSDALPDPFPTVDIANTPHTFSLQDGGGTLLMQLDTLLAQ